MAVTVTRVLVESAVRSLNAKLEELGWIRRYEFQMGSSANGVQHVLAVRLPHLVHPTQQEPIGNTLSKAHKYIEAMNRALNDAVAERKRLHIMAEHNRR